MSVKRVRLKSNLPKRATWSPGGGRRGAPGSGASTNGAGPVSTPGEEKRPVTPALSTGKRRLQRNVLPLEILQEPIQAGVRKVFDLRRFLLVLGLTALVLLLPAPPGLSAIGHRALALFVFTGAILALEPAPLPIAALLVPICQIALGIDDAHGAFLPFGQPTLFLVLGSLFLAEALRKHGLTRRLALYAIVNSGGKFPLLLLGLMSITAVLSMWVLNTAIAAVLIPVAITIAQRIQPAETARRALGLLVLSVAYASSIGGVATIMGSNENAIAVGLLDQAGGFGFVDWMKYGLPVALLLLPLSWWLLLRVMPVKNARIDLEPVRTELIRAGGLNNKEREVLAILLISVLLWLSGEKLEGLLGLPDGLLNHAVVALAAVALLSIEELIDWNDLKGVNWGVFFVIGAGLTLGDALNKTGAGLWFANLLAPALSGLPYVAILASLVIGGFVLTQFMNNVTLGAILAPILVELAEAIHLPPARLVIPMILAVALSYMLPVASARMTLVAVTGAVKQREMVNAGLIVGIPSAVVLIIFFAVLSSFGLI
jgi:solute carrier family 13 (sodium-dependent dicarboxylate transporter), member 2/3/5